MVLGKRKGRAYERSVYKRFRDDNRFSNVKLNLGSGSSDETSDISFSFIRKRIRIKTATMSVFTELFCK